MNNDQPFGPAPADIQALVDAVEAADPRWTVDGWEFEAGSETTPRLDVSVEWIPEETGTFSTPSAESRSRMKDVKDIIATVEAEYVEGAPIDEIVARAGQVRDFDEDTVREVIHKLRTRGEVYEPKEHHLRTT
jgi:replicative DNA helicase Mcm